MTDERPIVELDKESQTPDPDEVPIRERRLFTQPYDLVVQALIEQIESGTIFLRPKSDRPSFQRHYVWTDILASRLIESMLLNVPIPPCYLSQNEEFELDVIDGQQRLYSIYRFMDNQFPLAGLEVLTELNSLRFHQIPSKLQRQLKTHTLRCVLITNESHPEIKFDVFERLNSNTVPLNAQELRNSIYRGTLNALLGDVVTHEPWLEILGRRVPDKRMRDEELALRFYAFWIHGLKSYRTPQKHWLNEAARAGMKYTQKKCKDLHDIWTGAVNTSLVWFEPEECFRRPVVGKKTAVNRALFDLIMLSAAHCEVNGIQEKRTTFRRKYEALLQDELFEDLISRAVDHTSRTNRRFKMWEAVFGYGLT